MSVMSAPTRKPIYMLWGAYGTIGGAYTHPRGRLWLLADSMEPDAKVTASLAWNHPQTGQVVWADLGEVGFAKIKSSQWAEVHTSHGVVTLVAAPCVCGAGAVGNALPEPGRITLQYVSPLNRPNILMS